MAVKPTTDRTTTTALDAEAHELTRLLLDVIVCFKRSGPEPPEEIRIAAERGELGPRHVQPMLTLAFGDGLSVSELSERIGLSLPTTSQLVGELSRAGLVERSEDERDRRRTIVRLNDTYREGMQSLLTAQISPVRRALERLSPKARAQFLDSMRVLAEESARTLDA